MSLKVAIYARVSTTRDAQKDSIDNQIAYATDWITSKGWTVAGTYIDNGISGLKVKNRAQMQRLLADNGTIKIHYNIAHPQGMGDLLKGA